MTKLSQLPKHTPALLLTLAAGLCGCSALTAPAPVATSTIPGVALHGSIHGGQQPVSNATVQLYSVGTTADGASSTTLGASVKSLANGSFLLTGAYTCPTTPTLVYIVASGGNPGLSPASTSNAQLTMMTALGLCSSLSPATVIQINELTTVAAVAALTPYMTSYTAIGSYTTDATALANAFTLAGEFVNPATGTAPGATLPAGYTAPVAELDSLADAIATCINSAGGTYNDGTACGSLFLAVNPSGNTSYATETIGALLLAEKNPNQNVAAVFGLATASSPFQPVLTTALADLTVPLLPTSVNRILFVGDSFTHGRYSPVRNYGYTAMTDENYGLPTTSARAESSTEPGPYGGIPGIFKTFTTEAGLNYDVHIYAISSTSLQNLYADAPALIANPEWNSVVLQELSTRPISKTLTSVSSSSPSQYCNSVKTAEQGIHGVNSTASVYLYGTWARADEAYANAGGTSSTTATYASALQALTTAYHNAFYGAAVNDGKIAGVIATGDAWQLAITNGVVNPNPFTSNAAPLLWYTYNTAGSPANSATSPDDYHPSIYGAYLSALMLYGQITGQDPTALGSAESAATSLGISSAIAVQLQTVAKTQIATNSTATGSTSACSIQ